MTTPLAGVDRAAFGVALARRLRAVGVPVTLDDVAACTQALCVARVDRRDRLYWLMRTTLVHDQSHLERFDRVFAATFDHATIGADPHARRRSSPLPGRDDDRMVSVPGTDAASMDGSGLPWATRPARIDQSELTDDDTGLLLARANPSDLERLANVPFDELDPQELRSIEQALELALPTWPRRRTRRGSLHTSGNRVHLRSTLARSRRTGFEVIELLRERPVSRPRRLVMVCDVSQSMQPYTTAYLHLMRAVVRRADAEVFAFATSLTRLTPVLSHRDAEAAVTLASEAVSDRFGGTRIASNLRALLHARREDVTRGSVVLIASDGWDADPPPELAAVMRRLALRANRVVWLNPRAAAPDFAPNTGSMQAALPYCDEFVAADRLSTVLAALAAL